MKRYTWRCPAVKFLREHYPEKGAQFVADALGIDVSQVHRYAYKIGVSTTYRPEINGRPFTSENHPRRRTEVAHQVAH